MQGADIYTQEAKIISISEREVSAIIRNYSYIQARRYVGDLTGIPYLFAFEAAVKAAELNDEQDRLLTALLDDMPLGYMIASFGRKQQSIDRSKKRIIRKIAYNYESLAPSK